MSLYVVMSCEIVYWFSGLVSKMAAKYNIQSEGHFGVGLDC